jgi:hypothetical protein
MQIADPEVGTEGYFVLPRRCRHCAGNNLVELDGPQVIVRQQRRQRRRSNIATQRITAVKPLVA